MCTINKIAFYNLKYQHTILGVLWGLFVMCCIVPYNHPLAFPLYYATGVLWVRWVYFTQKLKRWGASSFSKTIILLLLWAISAVPCGFVIGTISSFIHTTVAKFWHIAILILTDPRLISDPKPFFDIVALIAIAVGIGILVGLLTVLVQRRNARLFKYLSIINVPLMVYSIYTLAKKIINYNSQEDDLSVIIIQCIFLSIALILDLYNRRKETVTGESSRAHYVVLGFEFIIYLQFILYSLIFQ